MTAPAIANPLTRLMHALDMASRAAQRNDEAIFNEWADELRSLDATDAQIADALQWGRSKYMGSAPHWTTR